MKTNNICDFYCLESGPGALCDLNNKVKMLLLVNKTNLTNKFS